MQTITMIVFVLVMANDYRADNSFTLSRSGRAEGPTKEDYLNSQQDGGLGDDMDNVYQTYYVQKRSDCQEYIRRFPDDEIPGECINCTNEFRDDICDEWAKNGVCEFNGSAAIQICSASCGTCQAASAFPALHLGCRDSPTIGTHCATEVDCSSRLNQLHCAGTCQTCNATDNEESAAFVNKPWACFADVLFGHLSPEQQFALACGCWGFNINAYAVCCGEVQAKYQETYLSCSDLPPIDRTYTHGGLNWASCCADYQCEEGYGCAYGDFPGRNEWGITYYDPDSTIGFPCTGRCVKGLSFRPPWVISTRLWTIPSPPSTTTEAGETTTNYAKLAELHAQLMAAPACCQEAQCVYDLKCLCGDVLSKTHYLNCADPHSCQGRCLEKKSIAKFVL